MAGHVPPGRQTHTHYHSLVTAVHRNASGLIPGVHVDYRLRLAVTLGGVHTHAVDGWVTLAGPVEVSQLLVKGQPLHGPLLWREHRGPLSSAGDLLFMDRTLIQ